jgi:antitoxin (DNA-binding transcriptional repressor) of toxin-antitoxin stability system
MNAAPEKTTFTVHEAKTHLSRLIAAALEGKEVVIARGKIPAVKLVPLEPKPLRVPGKYKGLFTVPDDLFDPMTEEELALWEGRDNEF